MSNQAKIKIDFKEGQFELEGSKQFIESQQDNINIAMEKLLKFKNSDTYYIDNVSGRKEKYIDRGKK